MKFSSTSIQVCRAAYILYLKIKAPIFCCPLFFKEYLSPPVRIYKMGNDHTLSYFYGLLRGLSLHNISWIFSQTCISHQPWLRKQTHKWRDVGYRTPLFLKSYFARGVFMEICFCIVLQGIQNFFGPSTPRILLGALEKFQIYGVKITGRYICEPKKMNLFIFAYSPKQNSPPGRRKLLISPKQHFLKIYFSPAERGEDMELKNWPKLTCEGVGYKFW